MQENVCYLYIHNNALNSHLRHYTRPAENRKNNYKSCPQKICSFKTPRKRQVLKDRKKSYYFDEKRKLQGYI